MNDLVDTTEMYLRTVYELEEEGLVPLRARIAERLEQSGPTVSQTVARMERDGLLSVGTDRRLELTPQGRSLAVAVMRKHRLAERLLVDVIGLDWSEVHTEACRWEHVMSEAVERRLVEVLDHPTTSPYGNPIPGLGELGLERQTQVTGSLSRLSEIGDGAVDGGGVGNAGVRARGGTGADGTAVVVRRIAEHVQTDVGLMSRLREAGVVPDARVTVRPDADGVLVSVTGHTGAHLSLTMAHAVQVEKV